MNKQKKVKAVTLVSGGLDSLLSSVIVKNLGIEVHGILCSTGLSSENSDKICQIGTSCGLNLEILDVSKGYVDLILHPEFGYGTAINPCIDCHIHFLRAAKNLMEKRGYDFVVTGEVLGQRPMSQHLQALHIVENESGLSGRLLRPLSAKLLPPTVAECEGLIDRNKLFDIQGRSRKRQIEMAKELDIYKHLQPAGGCFLTDKNYGRKFRDFLEHSNHNICKKDLLLLKIGRHFRLSESIKLIVGRNESENTSLTKYKRGNTMLAAVDCPGPVGILSGIDLTQNIELAASIILRYADTEETESTDVELLIDSKSSIITTKPISNDKLEDLRI
ncbi:MAG: hypothetical protein P9M03_12320 [Candidatus Theseobacter exili]|nr:hypothetical protein [Candidatus Theseobacter exili]